MLSSWINSICSSINSICLSFNKVKDCQSETQILRSLKNKNKAIDYAEKILLLTDDAYILNKNGELIYLKDYKPYIRLKNGFLKNNSV